MAGVFARLGLLHVLPSWCCVADADGARCAFCARLVGCIRTPARWCPFCAVGAPPSAVSLVLLGGCVEAVPLRTPSRCFGLLVSGTTAPLPPLHLHWPRFADLFAVGAFSWNEVVLCPGYMHFWRRGPGRLHSPRLSRCAPSVLSLHRSGHQDLPHPDQKWISLSSIAHKNRTLRAS